MAMNEAQRKLLTEQIQAGDKLWADWLVFIETFRETPVTENDKLTDKIGLVQWGVRVFLTLHHGIAEAMIVLASDQSDRNILGLWRFADGHITTDDGGSFDVHDPHRVSAFKKEEFAPLLVKYIQAEYRDFADKGSRRSR